MKKTLLAALLAALMLVCTGCASFLERDYSVVQPHSSTYYESEDRSVLRAESYQDLVNDLMLLLTGGAREGTIWLYAGTEPLDASAAAERACKEVQQETPLGAYAVKYLTYTIDDSARNYTAIHLTIGYRRTQEQIASMVYTTSVSALGELLTAAARRGSGELVVQVGYFDNQEEEVRSIVDQVQAMEAPEQKEPWTVNFYPEGGDVGIIEILLKKSGKKWNAGVDKSGIRGYNQPCVCGRSSSGRARPCQGRGSEFEPRRPLQKAPSEKMVLFLFAILS